MATSTTAYTLDPGPYVEVIDDAFGPVFLDRQGYGHRTAAYAERWNALGREQSGWDQMADGSFVSQAPLNKRGRPIDPTLPAAADVGPNLVVLGLAAAGAFCLWMAMRRGG